MKVLIIEILTILIFINSSVNAQGQCTKFLTLYYNCINGTYTLNRNNPLKDNFYNSILTGIDTFPKAMSHFRSLFQYVKSCQNKNCKCVKDDIVYMNSFSRFFTSPFLYPQMFSIVNEVKSKYTLLQLNQITNIDMFQAPILTYKNLNGFCLKYEYDSAMFYFYKQTQTCYDNYLNNPQYKMDCYSSYVSLDGYSANRNSKSQFEKYFSCLANLAKNCEKSIQRAIVLSFFPSAPTFINNDNNTNLTSYIDYLINLNYTPIVFRNSTWANTNNDTIKSLKKGEGSCRFRNNQDYALFDSNDLKITASISKAGDSLTLVFIYDKKLNYTLTSPSKHNKKQVTINDSKQNKWLEIKYGSINNDGHKYFLITDHKTSSTIKMNECKNGCSISLLSPNQLYKGAKGNFIDGCP